MATLPAIAGGAAGAIALLGLATVCWRRRKASTRTARSAATGVAMCNKVARITTIDMRLNDAAIAASSSAVSGSANDAAIVASSSAVSGSALVLMAEYAERERAQMYDDDYGGGGDAEMPEAPPEEEEEAEAPPDEQ